MSNPSAFEGAVDAAVAGKDDLFWDYVQEAMRFFPTFPIIVRACSRDTVIWADDGRPRKIRAGQKVTVGLLPAMFDPAIVPFPDQFRTDRARRNSFVFGNGLHACFGFQFVRLGIIALLMPLFARGFARAQGRAGKLQFDFVIPKSLALDLSPPARPAT